MYFVEAMQDYIDITDKYSLDLMKIDAYIESVMSELDINMQRSELKVLTESGTDDDLTYLYEAAEEGAIVKIKKAVVAVVEAFKKFISDLKDRVVRIIVTKTTRDTLSKVEKKVKLNPFIAKKKVKITDGPFKNMIGKVSSYDLEKKKVELILDLFGQETSVEVELSQIESPNAEANCVGAFFHF